MKIRALLCASLLAAVPLTSPAATATTSFTVAATVLTSCTVVAVALPFGNYDPTSSSPTDSSTTVSVLCTAGTAYNLRLGQGANGTGVSARKMIRAGGSDLLAYSLYRDASHTLNWGETDGTDTLVGSATGLLQLHTVYGRIASGLSAPAGVYSDSVTVTVNY